MFLFSDKKICWAQIHNLLINKDPLGQVKFPCLFKVTVLKGMLYLGLKVKKLNNFSNFKSVVC